MAEQIGLLNMFSRYEPPEELYDVLSQTLVTAADIDPATRRIGVTATSDNYISYRDLEQVAESIGVVYGLRSVSLDVKHPSHQLSKVEPDELMRLFVTEDSRTRGSLAGADWVWEENQLTIHLKGNGKAELEMCVPAVKFILSNRFGVDVQIQICPGESLEGQALFDAMEKMRSDVIAELPKTPVFVQKEQAPENNGAILDRKSVV